MELISLIQNHLHKLYGIDVGEWASDYLIGPTELKDLLPAGQQTITCQELFLVNPNPQEDTLEIALFFSPELQTNLMQNDPREGLSHQNVSDFCALIEGVSHFVCYLHKASLEHEVTQLELELQAEIDKYLLLACFSETDFASRSELIHTLFEQFSLRPDLNLEQEERYLSANQLARRYCLYLQRLLTQSRHQDWLQHVRQFYPASQQEKIRTILELS